uniref:Uncharacterized protein n=1 Tax=Clytia hemisphaerica TaxID=252671 RepID=A0A7M5VET9_9CNID
AKNTKMKVEKRFNRFYCEKRPKAACSTNQTTDLVVNKEQQVREEMEARMNEMKEKHEREMNELRASIKEHQEENEDQNQDEDDMLLEEGNELENSPPTEELTREAFDLYRVTHPGPASNNAYQKWKSLGGEDAPWFVWHVGKRGRGRARGRGGRGGRARGRGGRGVSVLSRIGRSDRGRGNVGRADRGGSIGKKVWDRDFGGRVVFNFQVEKGGVGINHL